MLFCPEMGFVFTWHEIRLFGESQLKVVLPKFVTGVMQVVCGVKLGTEKVLRVNLTKEKYF